MIGKHSQEWHEFRAKGIGGSDAAVVCGLSPWKSAYELYLEKRGEIPRSSAIDPNAAHWGTVLEATVADEYARRTGRKLRNIIDHFVSKDHDWQRAEVDRHIVAIDDGLGPGVLECKTSGAFNRNVWGPDGSTSFPEWYLLQVQHQLAVTGWQWGALAVLIGGRDYRIYPVQRDDDLINDLINIEAAFWQRVVDGNPPDIDFDHQSTAALMDRLYPGTNGVTITLDADAAHWHEVIQQAKEQRDAYDAVIRGAKTHLRTLIGNNAVGLLPDGTAYTRKVVKKKGFTVEPTEYVDFRFTKNPKVKE